jgi:hypothetical protein
MIKSVPEAETDENGRFTITGLELGAYVLIAMKEADGYPNPRWSFYSHREPLRVTLSSEAPNFDGAVLVLEPKGAAIAGTISDAITGVPVAATIHMWRADDENDFVDEAVKGSFRVLIPADTAVRFSIRATGYREWFHGGASEASRTATIASHGGDSQTLHVKLVPASQ